ncbi:HK97 gp10 family phage protein [Actinomadura sp. KC216]|uniref:HK97 gp10 family phage protein n=1 Tax=Actinomadura sp. KC216 TaxID=2530370 RepID=UPI00104A018C|nr:HK97 gp10 family phage protein [Actinomadura sp. KC216]TDB88353.1 HK97 gp10 family phage protein [Actinomadura sp. KC216]
MADDEVRDLIRDLDQIPRELRVQMRPALQRAGRDLLRQAQLNASWSSRIPSATRLSVRFSRDPAVDVRTDGRRAPHATHYENEGKPGTFKHPLFGNRSYWYSQRARPYLGPAFDAKADDAFAAMADAVDRVTRDAGFR